MLAASTIVSSSSTQVSSASTSSPSSTIGESTAIDSTTQVSSTANSSSGGPFVCPGDGLFAYPGDCTKYYSCGSGFAVVQVSFQSSVFCLLALILNYILVIK